MLDGNVRHVVTAMKSRSVKAPFVVLLTLFLLFSNLPVFAQTPEEERQTLEAELKTLEDKIARYETEIKGTQKEKQTLQSQIKILQNKIKKLDLQIQQGNLMIKDLKVQVKDTETAIDKTVNKLDQTRSKLKEALRALYRSNRRGTLEILLAQDRLSDFFTDVANLEILNSKVADNMANVKSLKTTLEDEKVSLDKEKEDLQRLVSVQTLQKQQSLGNKTQQETILETTKGKEALYQKYLAETKKKAAEIRSRIFEIIGVPQAPTFGQAYEIAKLVSKSTSIRPAFLLAVITQESNLGKQVGQCYLVNAATGEGIRILNNNKEPKTMNPTRDVPEFLKITRELGRDPYKTPISCPIAAVGGYGGGMGPAQFIPKTWVAYAPKVKEITGKSADPWNINDAFFAAGVYLKDLGGVKNEFNAAMRYFSGNSWTKYEEFYGRSVLEIASTYEGDIKTLEANQVGLGVKAGR